MIRGHEGPVDASEDRRGVVARTLHLYDTWVTFIGGDELPDPNAPRIVELEISGLPAGQEATRADLVDELRRRARKRGAVFVDPGCGIFAPSGAMSEETGRLIDSALSGGSRMDDPAYWEELREGARLLEESQGQEPSQL